MVILVRENVLEHAPKHVLAHQLQMDARDVQVPVLRIVVTGVVAVALVLAVVVVLVVVAMDAKQHVVIIVTVDVAELVEVIVEVDVSEHVVVDAVADVAMFVVVSVQVDVKTLAAALVVIVAIQCVLTNVIGGVVEVA